MRPNSQAMLKNKLSIRILLFLISFTLLYTGCKKDEDEKKNEVTYNEGKYPIANAKIIDLGQSNYVLGLSSSGLTWDIGTAGYDINGTGTILLFQLLGNIEGELPNGTYFFSASSEANPMTIYYSLLFFNFDFSNLVGTQSYITSGKIDIQINASKGEITINTSDPSGNGVKGYYKGLIEFDNVE